VLAQPLSAQPPWVGVGLRSDARRFLGPPSRARSARASSCSPAPPARLLRQTLRSPERASCAASRRLMAPGGRNRRSRTASGSRGRGFGPAHRREPAARGFEPRWRRSAQSRRSGARSPRRRHRARKPRAPPGPASSRCSPRLDPGRIRAWLSLAAVRAPTPVLRRQASTCRPGVQIGFEGFAFARFHI